MDTLHQHKAKSGFEFPVVAFDPGEFVHQWQARASKLLHAQERIAQGLAAAARAQLRYSQEYMINHANMMHWDAVDAEHLSAQARKDIENFAAMVKEMSGEIRGGFAEAGEMLEIKPLAKPREAAAEAAADKIAELEAREPVASAPEVSEPVTSEPVASESVTSEPAVSAQAAAEPAPKTVTPTAEAAAPEPAKKTAPQKAAPVQVKRATRRVNPRG